MRVLLPPLPSRPTPPPPLPLPSSPLFPVLCSLDGSEAAAEGQAERLVRGSTPLSFLPPPSCSSTLHGEQRMSSPSPPPPPLLSFSASSASSLPSPSSTASSSSTSSPASFSIIQRSPTAEDLFAASTTASLREKEREEEEDEEEEGGDDDDERGGGRGRGGGGRGMGASVGSGKEEVEDDEDWPDEADERGGGGGEEQQSRVGEKRKRARPWTAEVSHSLCQPSTTHYTADHVTDARCVLCCAALCVLRCCAVQEDELVMELVKRHGGSEFDLAVSPARSRTASSHTSLACAHTASADILLLARCVCCVCARAECGCERHPVAGGGSAGASPHRQAVPRAMAQPAQPHRQEAALDGSRGRQSAQRRRPLLLPLATLPLPAAYELASSLSSPPLPPVQSSLRR